MNQVVDRAIVLRRTNYGDRDRVVTFLAKDQGKISVFAKGVRSQRSRLSAGIELLSISEISTVEGKSELKTLTGARLIKHFDNVVKDMQKTQNVFEALKRINDLVEDNHGQEYYEILETYLASLDDEKYDPRIVEMWFALHLLNVSGVLGNIDVIGTTDNSDNDSRYTFDYDKQVFIADSRGSFSQDDIKLLRLLEQHKHPVKLSRSIESEENLLKFIQILTSENLK